MPSATCRPKPGMRAPTREASRHPAAMAMAAVRSQDRTTTLSYHMTFYRRWNCPARSATGRLAADASSRRSGRRNAPWRRALLRQIAFAGRIRLRSRLGRRLRTRRRQLLSQTSGGGAVHAGHRSPPAGALGRARRRRAKRTRRPACRHLQAFQCVLCARHLSARGRMADAWRARLSAAHPPPVPLGERGLRQLRRLPRRAVVAQAQDHPSRACGRARKRHHRRLADRLRPHRTGLGHLLRLLHGDRLAQMGPALSHALVLFHRRREDGATRSCW